MTLVLAGLVEVDRARRADGPALERMFAACSADPVRGRRLALLTLTTDHDCLTGVFRIGPETWG